MDVLDCAPVELVEDVDLKDVFFPWDLEPWHFPYVPTRCRWRPAREGRYGRLTCQLYGVWNAAAKNPPAEDVPRLLSALPGFEVAGLGRHLSVRQCVQSLAAADLFFGVDSGMLQLAYAVGTPAFLITCRQDHYALLCWHGDKHAVWCQDADEFIMKARCFLGLRDRVA